MSNSVHSGHPPELAFEGAVATLTLRRPGVANRLDLDDLHTLRQRVAQAEQRPEVRVLKLQAEGRHFCSGFHIGQVHADAGGVAKGAEGFEAVADALEQSRLVSVAVIQGGVYGGGADVALACDFRMGCPASTLMVPAARLGVVYYRGGLQRFVTRLGLQTAKRILLSAQTLDAQALERCGYLDRLLPSEEAMHAEADALIQRLAHMAPLALQGMKHHLNHIARGTLDAAALAQDMARAAASQDVIEGARAWEEKREPRFTGH
ncbi:MAG: enoyl-CoA hydratase/isomerase family protein [Betaproteobacteria bacterium]|nr:enoyl-CoA hydratase/isomerase family protein [Betaproteobacteria bacterium]